MRILHIPARLGKLRHGALLCLAAAAAVSGARADGDQAGKPAFRVTYFPRAAYRDEPTTFVVEGEPGWTVTARLNGRTLASAPIEKEVLELNLALPEAGGLVLAADGRERAFRVVAPDHDAPLAARTGYLEADGRPVILLPDHRHPPKVDRRWQTVKWIRGLAVDTRPVIPRWTFVGGRTMRPSARAKMTEGLPGRWTVEASTNGFYELDGLIAGLPRLSPAPGLCLGLSGADLERGIHDLAFRMKLEWYLQALQRFDLEQVVVVSLPLSARDTQRFPEINEAVKLAARANRAMYVEGFFHRDPAPLPPADYLARVVERIGEVIRFE